MDEWGFSPEDAFMFLSVAGDLGIAAYIDPSPGRVIARMRVPKLASNPTPFRRRSVRREGESFVDGGTALVTTRRGALVDRFADESVHASVDADAGGARGQRDLDAG